MMWRGLIVGWVAVVAVSAYGAVDRGAVLAQEVRRADRTWGEARALSPGLASRALFSAALAYCEAEEHLDRLPRLLAIAARMEDRGPECQTYATFRWMAQDGAVQDRNAVEFSM